MSLHNAHNAGLPIYLSSFFYDEAKTGDAVQTLGMIAIIALQGYFLILGFLTSLIGDIVPLFIALNYEGTFESINTGLKKLQLVYQKDFCAKLGGGRLSPSTLALVSGEIDQKTEESMTKYVSL